MNGFHHFDDFRVSAWMDDDGLMIRLAEKAKSMANTIKKAALAVSVCAVAATTMVSATAAAQITENPSVQFSLEAAVQENEVDAISRQIDAELEALMDFSMIDQSLLQLANEAVLASVSRTSAPPADWAGKIFPLES